EAPFPETVGALESDDVGGVVELAAHGETVEVGPGVAEVGADREGLAVVDAVLRTDIEELAANAEDQRRAHRAGVAYQVGAGIEQVHPVGVVQIAETAFQACVREVGGEFRRHGVAGQVEIEVGSLGGASRGCQGQEQSDTVKSHGLGLPMDVDGAYGTGIYMIPLNVGPDTRSRG